MFCTTFGAPLNGIFGVALSGRVLESLGAGSLRDSAAFSDRRSEFRRLSAVRRFGSCRHGRDRRLGACSRSARLGWERLAFVLSRERPSWLGPDQEGVGGHPLGPGSRQTPALTGGASPSSPLLALGVPGGLLVESNSARGRHRRQRVLLAMAAYLAAFTVFHFNVTLAAAADQAMRGVGPDLARGQGRRWSPRRQDRRVGAGVGRGVGRAQFAAQTRRPGRPLGGRRRCRGCGAGGLVPRRAGPGFRGRGPFRPETLGSAAPPALGGAGDRARWSSAACPD